MSFRAIYSTYYANDNYYNSYNYFYFYNIPSLTLRFFFSFVSIFNLILYFLKQKFDFRIVAIVHLCLANIALNISLAFGCIITRLEFNQCIL